MDENAKLEEENRRLRAQLDKIDHQKKEKWSKRYRFSKNISGKFLGTRLKNAINAFFTELQQDKTVSKDTASDLLAALFIRITRVGAFVIITSLLPTLLILLQVYYLRNQNDLITGQNNRMKQQTFLQEAERRSFMFGVLDEIINDVTGESSKNSGYISKRSRTRLIAISKNLKPYRYLENDTLTKQALSPERGYLLLSILANEIDLKTIVSTDPKKTFGEALNFEFAELNNAFVTNLSLININLNYSDLKGSNFQKSLIQGRGRDHQKASFRNANLEYVVFDLCTLKRCDFSKAEMTYVSFADSEIVNTLFVETNLQNADFSSCDLIKVNFTDANIMNANFNNASVEKDFMEKMKIQLNSENYDYLEDSFELKTSKKGSVLVHRK